MYGWHGEDVYDWKKIANRNEDGRGRQSVKIHMHKPGETYIHTKQVLTKPWKFSSTHVLHSRAVHRSSNSLGTNQCTLANTHHQINAKHQVLHSIYSGAIPHSTPRGYPAVFERTNQEKQEQRLFPQKKRSKPTSTDRSLRTSTPLNTLFTRARSHTPAILPLGKPTTTPRQKTDFNGIRSNCEGRDPRSLPTGSRPPIFPPKTVPSPNIETVISY